MHSSDSAAAAAGEGDRRHIGGAAGNGDVVVRVGRPQFDALAEPRAQRLQVPRRISGRRREQWRQGVIGGGRERGRILKKGAARFVRVAPVIAAAGSDVGPEFACAQPVEEPLKTQSVALVSSWLGKMSNHNCAWLCSKGTKESADTTNAAKRANLLPMPDARFLTNPPP